MKTDQTRPEKRTAWLFLIEDGGAVWRWEKVRPSGDTVRSDVHFESLESCARDATAHGYGAWQTDERRQVTPRLDALATVD